ncbi:MAG: hypothetical protein LBK99_09320 [Opitutaceae bacterium]|jgi:hypothetical protein|nr:hypothetical protein [Opitutaceae bacterium]
MKASIRHLPRIPRLVSVAGLLAGLALLATPAAHAQAAVNTVTENFESYSPGAGGADLGWTFLFGDDSTGANANLRDWKVVDTTAIPAETWPEVPVGNGTKSFSHSATGNSHAIKKAFGVETTFTDATPVIYYSAWAVPDTTGTGVMTMRFGTVSGNNGYMINLFSIEPDATTSSLARFNVGTGNNGATVVASTNTFATDHWYEFQLVIDQSKDALNPTLSLFARDITNGETTLSAVAGLQNLSITLTGSTKASTWSAWAIRSGGGRQNIDNLRLSIDSVSNIPEPKTAAALCALAALGAAAAKWLRRN